MGEFNPQSARKCPDCHEKNYTRSNTYARVLIVVDGKTVSNTLRIVDAGNFKCNTCGFEEGV